MLNNQVCGKSNCCRSDGISTFEDGELNIIQGNNLGSCQDFADEFINETDGSSYMSVKTIIQMMTFADL